MKSEIIMSPNARLQCITRLPFASKGCDGMGQVDFGLRILDCGLRATSSAIIPTQASRSAHRSRLHHPEAHLGRMVFFVAQSLTPLLVGPLRAPGAQKGPRHVSQ